MDQYFSEDYIFLYYNQDLVYYTSVNKGVRKREVDYNIKVISFERSLVLFKKAIDYNRKMPFYIYGLDESMKEMIMKEKYTYYDLTDFFDAIIHQTEMNHIINLFALQDKPRLIYEKIILAFNYTKQIYLREKVSEYQERKLEILDTTHAKIDLRGKCVCITGRLNLLTRSQAFGMIMNKGGYPTDSMNFQVDILVVSDFSKENGIESTKLNLAKEKIKRGYPVTIISEDLFYECIDLEFQY